MAELCCFRKYCIAQFNAWTVWKIRYASTTTPLHIAAHHNYNYTTSILLLLFLHWSLVCKSQCCHLLDTPSKVPCTRAVNAHWETCLPDIKIWPAWAEFSSRLPWQNLRHFPCAQTVSAPGKFKCELALMVIDLNPSKFSLCWRSLISPCDLVEPKMAGQDVLHAALAQYDLKNLLFFAWMGRRKQTLYD